MRLVVAAILNSCSRPSWCFPAAWYGDKTHGCADKHTQCESWATHGQCKTNPQFMRKDCPRSCHSCGWDLGDMAPMHLRASEREQDHLMRPGSHGTCAGQVQQRLRWSLNPALASKIGCFNRAGAEPVHSWETSSLLVRLESMRAGDEITFFDSVLRPFAIIASCDRRVSHSPCAKHTLRFWGSLCSWRRGDAACPSS